MLSIVATAQKKFPNSEVYLLGHSEGTYGSLQVAKQNNAIAGVALIGFAEYLTDTLAYAQTVYRPLHNFDELDKNVDGQLDDQELSVDVQLAKSLKLQRKLLDNNKDGDISRAEFQAANFANLLVQDTFGPFRKQEAEYPRVAEILKSTDKKIAFFQGMLDNQTPAFHTMAFDLLLTQMGKTNQMQFNYFPGLGHALDPRENYQDVMFSPIDQAALTKLTNSLDQFFKKD